jgi:hypothetical protein
MAFHIRDIWKFTEDLKSKIKLNEELDLNELKTINCRAREIYNNLTHWHKTLVERKIKFKRKKREFNRNKESLIHQEIEARISVQKNTLCKSIKNLENQVKNLKEDIQRLQKERTKITRDQKENIIINLNICGKMFQVSKNILKQECGELFSVICSETNLNNGIYLDRDPETFGWYLSCVLTNGKRLKTFTQGQIACIANEATFFRNDYLINLCKKHHLLLGEL